MPTAGELGFIGTQRATLDGDALLRIPRRYVKLLGREVLLGPRDGAIGIWPEAAFSSVADALRAAPRAQRRWFAGKATTRRLVDNKLTLPQRLLELAEIGGALVIAGAFECVELWSPSRWTEIDTPTPPGGSYIV